MISRWYSHLKFSKEQQEFKQLVLASHVVLDRLATILEEKISQSIDDAEKVDNYTFPGWDKYQADLIGYRRAMKEVLNYLKNEEK